MTVIVATHASTRERAAAYPSDQARGLVERICQEAEGGDRHVLVELFELLFDTAGYDLRQVSTASMIGRVIDAVSRDRLLVVPGWHWTSGYAARPEHKDGAPETASAQAPEVVRRVVEALAAVWNGHIPFKGLNYRVVSFELGQPPEGTVEYELVDSNDATAILKNMATEVRAAPAVKAALEQASRLVASRPPPGAAGARLALWREARRGGEAAPPDPRPPTPARPAPPPPRSAPAERPDKQVVSIEWTDADAWCSEHPRFHGTTAGYGNENLDVRVQERAGAAHDISVKVADNAFSGAWGVVDVLPPKVGGHAVKELKIDAAAGGQKSPAPLGVRFAPSVGKISRKHGSHEWQVSVEDFVLKLEEEIKFVPGWAAEVVKLGGAAKPGIGGLLDGQLPWAGYRWMKKQGLERRFWDGIAWQVLPKGFVLIDANNFAVGFYDNAGDFTCQYGGNWPEKFVEWNIDAPDKRKRVHDWESAIHKVWSGALDLKRLECRSGKKECCRYPIKATAKFARQAAFAAGMLIVADGDIRSNDSLFFLGDGDSKMAAHEFGHHIGNPDEYPGADIDRAINGDGARNGIDADSIMGMNMSKVKARHLKAIAEALHDAILGEYGRSFRYQAVKP